MKLVMTLLVRNEEDIIWEQILFHLNMGVDFLIATDNNSSDSTSEILQEFVNKGLLHLIVEKEDNYAQAEWVTRMARIASSKYHADWVINSDADEFWWPSACGLKDVLGNAPNDVFVLQVQRSDFIPRNEIEGSIFHRMIIKNLDSMNHVGDPLPPKICHRGMDEIIIDQGNHTVLSPSGLKSMNTDAMEILHFPMRSLRQFSNKIALGGAAYERNMELPAYIGDGWRRLYKMYLKGDLAEYYSSRVIDQITIDSGIQDRKYIFDTKLRDYLIKERIISPIK
jgi:hypothetical protein